MRAYENPLFPVLGAERAIEQLRESRPALVRPLVIVSGYHSPSIPAKNLARILKQWCRPHEPPLVVSYAFARQTTVAEEAVVGSIERRGWGRTEVDIIGISMGGVLARAVIASGRVRAARLMTLASPHRGAMLAEFVRPDSAAADLRRGSAFLERIDRALPNRRYELVCYASLRDWWVGARRAAPEGSWPIWLDPARLWARGMSHFAITSDRHILADVCLRLTGGKPVGEASEPPRD